MTEKETIHTTVNELHKHISKSKKEELIDKKIFLTALEKFNNPHNKLFKLKKIENFRYGAYQHGTKVIKGGVWCMNRLVFTRKEIEIIMGKEWVGEKFGILK